MAKKKKAAKRKGGRKAAKRKGGKRKAGKRRASKRKMRKGTKCQIVKVCGVRRKICRNRKGHIKSNTAV